jgi:hypothetical protein
VGVASCISLLHAIWAGSAAEADVGLSGVRAHTRTHTHARTQERISQWTLSSKGITVSWKAKNTIEVRVYLVQVDNRQTHKHRRTNKQTTTPTNKPTPVHA